MKLTSEERDLLDGDAGLGTALAMRIITEMAELMGAERLLDITGAHIDGGLYHGQAGLDFALRLLEGGARARVPTTLNVASLDLIHPDLYRGDPDLAVEAHRLIDAYLALGCAPTFTCAPYQLASRPGFGEQVAWGESNAIVFANSVLGARTNRYGDFLDICCAVTGRAPAAGLHLDAARRATLVFDVTSLPMAGEPSLYAVLGHLVGRLSGSEVPAVVGLPASADEDHLKALGAAAASSGSVAMFHAVGITPEAPSLIVATGGGECPEVEVSMEMMREARDQLSTATGGIDAVSLGTPHASAKEMKGLMDLLAGRQVALPLYVSTGRDVLAACGEWVGSLQHSGVRVVTDTCTYITPILSPDVKVVMTDSAKWAYYAPGNLGVEVVFASTRECVESAVRGEAWRDEHLWR